MRPPHSIEAHQWMARWGDQSRPARQELGRRHEAHLIAGVETKLQVLGAEASSGLERELPCARAAGFSAPPCSARARAHPRAARHSGTASTASRRRDVPSGLAHPLLGGSRVGRASLRSRQHGPGSCTRAHRCNRHPICNGLQGLRHPRAVRESQRVGKTLRRVQSRAARSDGARQHALTRHTGGIARRSRGAGGSAASGAEPPGRSAPVVWTRTALKSVPNAPLAGRARSRDDFCQGIDEMTPSVVRRPTPAAALFPLPPSVKHCARTRLAERATVFSRDGDAIETEA